MLLFCHSMLLLEFRSVNPQSDEKMIQIFHMKRMNPLNSQLITILSFMTKHFFSCFSSERSLSNSEITVYLLSLMRPLIS